MSVTWLALVAVASTFLFGAILLGGGTAALVARRSFLIVGIIAPFLGVQARGIEDVQGSLSALDVFRGGFPAFAWLVCGAIRIDVVPKRRLPGVLVAFMGWSLLSCIWSIAPRETVLRFVMYAGCIACTVALANSFRDWERSLHAMLRGLVCFLIVSPVVWLLTSLFFPELNPAGTLRLNSVVPFVHPNLYAFLVGVAILAMLTGVISEFGIARGPSFVALSALLVVSMLGAQTRSSMLALLCVIFLYWVRTFLTRPRVALGMFGLFLVAAVLGLSKPDAVVGYFRRGQTDEQIARLTGRVDYWDSAIDAIGASPWLGHGFYAGHRFGLEVPAGKLPPSNLDNSWLEVWVNVGLIGLVLFALVWSSFFFSVRALHKANSRSFAQAVVLYGFLVSWVNPSLQDVNAVAIILVYLMTACLLPQCDSCLTSGGRGSVDRTARGVKVSHRD